MCKFSLYVQLQFVCAVCGVLTCFHFSFVSTQIWTFLRTDVDHNKMKVMAIRPEAMSLRPSSRIYMQKVLSNEDIGLKSARKDFLDKATTD